MVRINADNQTIQKFNLFVVGIVKVDMKGMIAINLASWVDDWSMKMG